MMTKHLVVFVRNKDAGETIPMPFQATARETNILKKLIKPRTNIAKQKISKYMKILNREDTELNFIVGLCLGHDILFTRYSKAPVSTLIVKDRMMGNNPAGALYGWHARRHLFHKDKYRFASEP
jgi:uncharacterized metal-binding protein